MAGRKREYEYQREEKFNRRKFKRRKVSIIRTDKETSDRDRYTSSSKLNDEDTRTRNQRRISPSNDLRNIISSKHHGSYTIKSTCSRYVVHRSMEDGELSSSSGDNELGVRDERNHATCSRHVEHQSKEVRERSCSLRCNDRSWSSRRTDQDVRDKRNHAKRRMETHHEGGTQSSQYSSNLTSRNYQALSHREYRSARGVDFVADINSRKRKAEGIKAPYSAKGKRPIGYRRLEEFSNIPKSDELVMIVIREKESFKALITSDEHLEKKDWIEKILQIFSICCQTTFDANKTEVMSLIMHEEYFNKVSKKILLAKFWPVASGNTSYQSKEKPKSLKIAGFLLDICETVMEIFNEKMLDVPLDHVQLFIKQLPQEEEILKKLNKLINIRDDWIEQSNQPGSSKKNFRNLSIIPTTEDFHGNTNQHLLPIPTCGAFENGDQYLETHFLLLREDLINPLREAILEEKNTKPMCKKKPNRSVYTDVKLQKIDYAKVGIIHKVNFNISRFTKVNWKYSKRLMNNNLVCFSKDEFQSMIFGIIAGRSEEDLKEGLISVRFLNVEEAEEYFKSAHQVVMVESSVFFEAYKHVLESLKEMKSNDIPFQRYLVNSDTKVGKGETRLPKYLINLSSARYDVNRPLGISSGKIDILDDESWGLVTETKLNPSQLEAVKAALTNEFVVIQGPPGCGKTHVGLRIVDILLRNKAFWCKSPEDAVLKESQLNPFEALTGANNMRMCRGYQMEKKEHHPMLLVCYTNHALDQFVEGLVNIGYENLIRVGGRASDKLRRFTLQEKRNERGYITESQMDAVRVSKQLTNQRNVKAQDIRNNDRDFLASLITGEFIEADFYQSIMSDEHFDSLRREFEFYERYEALIFDVFLEIGAINKKKLDGIIERIKVENQGYDKRNEDYYGKDEDDEIDEMYASVFTRNLVEPTFLNVKIIKAVRSNCIEDRERRQKYVEGRLYSKDDAMSEEEAKKFTDVWLLPLRQRWRLFRYWLSVMRKQDDRDRDGKIQEYENICKQINEVDQRKDELNLRGADVIAMTTTGAAKHRRILANLNPKIVVIEEAAEVMEAHVVSSLTSSVEHLILIGDHKQLKPKPSVYKLAKRYHLDLSLFERMVNNGIKVYTLSTQHRMRPEISKVLRHIYPDLEDAPVVSDYKNVKGIDKNIFFINHAHFESENDEIKSVSNEHEASFIAALSEYLLKQDYDSSKITVISGYAGQTMVLKNKLKKLSINICVTSIDNYQGEENDIVLLSLVRSNKNERLGFMKTENRVCVALSRAKIGLFLIGNFDMFVKGSTMWKKIIADAKEAGCYGEKLILHCANHNHIKTAVACVADFKPCSLKCDFWFKCGHMCGRECHVTGMAHEGYKCDHPCVKKPCSVDGHQCTSKCHFDTKCPPCQIEVTKIIPPCQHKQRMPCYVEPDDFNCQEKCENRLDCGHPCKKRCFKECNKSFCGELVEKKLSCGHTTKIACNRVPGPCMEKIKKLQKCGHEVMIECSKEPTNCKTNVSKSQLCGHSVFVECSVLPGPCKVSVSKELPCKHKVVTECSSSPPCQENVRKKLDCGHFLRGICSEKPRKCLKKVNKTLPCRHLKNMECFRNVNDVEDCDGPCKKKLECGHTCSGKCGECFKGRLHRKCTVKCKRSLICSHLCQEPCTKNCPPCSLKCQNRCKHSKCRKQCGEECTPCKMKCEWKCVHKSCTKECHELCDRQPCNEPCQKELKCKHMCIGLCGEECPPLCRVCDKVEVEEIFFGDEDLPGARYICLPDCKHIFEVNGLDRWMETVTNSNEENSQIKMKDCPKCKRVIQKCQRYGNIIKTQWNDIANIKRKVLDEGNNLKILKERVNEKLRFGMLKVWALIRRDRVQVTDWMQEKIRTSKSTHVVVELENKLNLLLQISQLYENGSFIHRRNEKIHNQLERLKYFVFRRFLNDEQQIHDAETEIQRLQLHMATQEASDRYEHLRGQDEEKQKTINRDKKRLDEILELLSRGTKIDNVDEYITEIKGIQKRGDINSKLTDQERVMIVKAVGFKKGHWYKCPNGHYYAIGECGGAMEKSKCPECKADIGGSNHRLTGDNLHAPEFDNSTAPAWSEAANIMNYDLVN